ncbi:MAG: flagellar basal body P-ring protein FlgI [Alphaproteobacteria bacterium]|nr:flagellar basal body P-ring protein FlgI [Alphaproteobacteria bacterium]MBV9694997.1 flagellar basal body P-ring protein FlgI [Alphaproteobacteria bacterium]
MTRWIASIALLAALAGPSMAVADAVRLKDLGRFLGWRDNALVGYGLVTGLAGSGDSPRSAVTKQALSNVLGRLGSNVPPDLLESRNVAAVIVTSTLPPTAKVGDRIDVTATSIGDARSLAGGVLLMTPLLAADQKPYALAQGPLVVGGYNFQDNGNLRQKNYPTTGICVGGATVEAPVDAQLVGAGGNLTFVLNDPDFTTAERVSEALNRALGAGRASAKGADSVSIDAGSAGSDLNHLVAQVENVTVDPDQVARVVINERSGTVVAGGNVRISSVVIAQGDIKVAVDVDHQASQPLILGGIAPDVRSLIVTNSKLKVADGSHDAVVRFPDTTVGDLVKALAKAQVDTRRTIAVLQAMKAAGALHAEIIVQ